MTQSVSVWGIHMGEHVGTNPIDQDYVAIGWPELGDLRKYSDRETLKSALDKTYPEKKPGALPVQAGVLYRFAYEMKVGDIVVYPSKHDRMVNIGRFTGNYNHVADGSDGYPNRRAVKWLDHLPRNEFSQSALYEIGASPSVFLIQKYAGEFLAKIGMAESTDAVLAAELDEETLDDDIATVEVSKQAETATNDFIIRQIEGKFTGYEFEEFVAHLLECMGYTARITPHAGDGGVDVIAHRDKLGVEPPILKVQCKRTISQISIAQVNQLLGTLGDGEYGLFITLGSFSKEVVVLERTRPTLRLISGGQLVDLLLEHYDRLSPRYRSIIPLKQIYVPDMQG